MSFASFIDRSDDLKNTLSVLVMFLAAAFLFPASYAYYKMLGQANAKQNETGERFSPWNHDPFSAYRLHKVHRALYPKSNLRIISISGMCGVLGTFLLVILLATHGYI